MKKTSKYCLFVLFLVVFFIQLGCTKEKIIAVKHQNTEVNVPVCFKNYYKTQEDFILSDFNPTSVYYQKSIIRAVYVKNYILYSGDCKTHTESDGCESLLLNNITDSNMNVTFQLGNKTETVFIKAKTAITKNDFPDFCTQPDLRIISYDYL
jgi:hypothetical protein